MADHYNTSYHPEYSFPTDFPHLDSARGNEPSILSQLDMSYDDQDWDSAVRNDFNLMPYPDSSSTTSPSSMATSTEGPRSCSPPLPLSDSLVPGVVHTASPQPQTRKPKDKPRIDLAPDQPPTTEGRPRARVFVACLQCRGRKIRCDGAKPKCYHCSRRQVNQECTYDSIPKRRGPDRTQRARVSGTRQEIDRGPYSRRRRCLPTTVDKAGSSNGTQQPRVVAKPSLPDTLQPQQCDAYIDTLDPGFELLENVAGFSISDARDHSQMLTVDSASTGYASSVPDERENDDEATYRTIETSVISEAHNAVAQRRLELDLSDITPDPSVQFSRETWFDHVRDLYAISAQVSGDSSYSVLAQRDSTSQIIEDVRFIFKSSYYWFSFLNVPRFYNNLMDPIRRSRMQPSLLLSLLAVSQCLQGVGRLCPEGSYTMALMLRDEAQGYLEASLQARAIDVELAQAAWVLALIEICAHPQHQLSRMRSSLNILDAILRFLAMTDLDADNPAASKFTPNAVPVVEVSSEEYIPTSECHPNSTSMLSPTQQGVSRQQSLIDTNVPESRCPCVKLSLGSQWPEAHKQVPFWVHTPTWNREWSEGEIKKEECRRLCWSSLMLASGQTSFADAVSWKVQDLFLLEPSNYSILFPGESLLPSHPSTYCDAMSGKNTIWALYLRATLLFNACVRMRQDATLSDFEKRDFAMRAWIETEAIEEALQGHTCNVEWAFVYHGREILFNTRMCISYDFQRFIPHVLVGINRRKSEEWLRAQGKRVKAIIFSMYTTNSQEPNILLRPWYMFWFMGQIYRALKLWRQDKSLTIALDMCNAYLEIIEYIITFYPGPAQQARLDALRELVVATLASAGGYVPTPIDNL